MRNVLNAETLPGLFPGWGILDAVILHLGNEPDENGLSLVRKGENVGADWRKRA